MAVPPQLARKMSVLSVDPPAPWAPGQIAAGRAHRPGSRRLGGVEAPGASPATGASWPDRRKGWASPGRGVSKYAHLTSSPSTGSIISRYVAFHISLHVASLILLTHELIVWSHFRREEDYGCVLGLKGDARAPRKIFERDGGKLQPPTTR